MTIFSKVLLLLTLLTVPVDAAALSDSSSYQDWVTQTEDSYTHKVFLADDKVAVQWRVEDATLYLGVAAAAAGWVGFGLADAGRMKGADIVVFEAAKKEELMDMYALDNAKPSLDASQDWVLDSSTTDASDSFIAFEGHRTLNTSDPQDRVLMDDSQPHMDATPIIVAWGDQETLSFHGSNTARGVVRFFGPPVTTLGDPLLTKVQEEATGTFVVAADNYVIPQTETTYYEFCLDLAGMEGTPDLNETTHLIGVDFIPSVDINGQDTLAHVHHFAAYGAALPCDHEDRFPQFFYGWGPGQPPLLFPDEVGIPIGGSTGGFVSINLQIHYDNKQELDDLVDSTGIRLYYTETLRPNTGAVLFMGDPYTSIKPQPVGGDGPSHHVFTCPSSCTALEFAPDTEVTVFSEAFHMHQTAQRGVNQQYRNGTLVRQASVDFFDFWVGGIQHAKQAPYVVQPGDEFVTHCYFDASGVEGQDVVFGNGTRDEMCVAFLWYYPAISQTGLGFCGPGFGDWTGGACEGVYEQVDAADVPSDFDRVFGSVQQAVEDDAESSDESVDGGELGDGTPSEDESSAAGSILRGVAGLVLSSSASVVVAFLV